MGRLRVSGFLGGLPGAAGDMEKSVYDANANDVVDNSEKLEGSTKAQVQDHTPKAHTHTAHQSAFVEGTTDTNTTSSTWVDMAQMSITITTGNKPVLILFGGSVGHGSDTNISLAIKVDDEGEEAPAIVYDLAAGSCKQVHCYMVKTLSAGEHTIKGRWKTSAGTIYNRPATQGAFEARRIMVIELI